MTGEDALQPGVRGHGFTDDPWGEVSHKVVVLTTRLEDNNWAAIIQECSIYLPACGVRMLGRINLGDLEDERVNPYACIDIDW